MRKEEGKQTALSGQDDVGVSVVAESNLTYEAAFAELETILQALESDDLPLEASLALYEQGIALVAHCTHLLDSAELRVRQWQSDGTITNFGGWQEG